LGLEALYKIGRGLDHEIDFIIVSDASAKMGFQKHRRFASLSNMKRLLDISLEQVHSLRKREFRAAVAEQGLGVYLRIGEQAGRYHTTLHTPCETDFNMILYDGYEKAKDLLIVS